MSDPLRCSNCNCNGNATHNCNGSLFCEGCLRANSLNRTPNIEPGSEYKIIKLANGDTSWWAKCTECHHEVTDVEDTDGFYCYKCRTFTCEECVDTCHADANGIQRCLNCTGAQAPAAAAASSSSEVVVAEVVVDSLKMSTCHVCGNFGHVVDGIKQCQNCPNTSCPTCQLCDCTMVKTSKRSRDEEGAESSLAATILECPHCTVCFGDTPDLRSCRTCRVVWCNGCLCDCEYLNKTCVPAAITRSVQSKGLSRGGEVAGNTFQCDSDKCKQDGSSTHGICYNCKRTVDDADEGCDTATCEYCDAFFCRDCFPVKNQKEVIDNIDGGLLQQYCTRCNPDEHTAKRSRK